MACKERGCIFPATTGSGYCAPHARDHEGDLVPGMSVKSSLGNTEPRATGAVIPAKPAESNWPNFVPVMTVGPSVLNPGNKVYFHHMPGGKKEPFGKIGAMTFALSRDRYVEELWRRFKLRVDADKIQDPHVAVAAPTPAIPALRSHGHGTGKSQSALVLEAVQGGAATSQACADVTGLPAGTCASVLSALNVKRQIHKVRTDSSGRATWAIGPALKAEPHVKDEAGNTLILISDPAPVVEPAVGIEQPQITAAPPLRPEPTIAAFPFSADELSRLTLAVPAHAAAAERRLIDLSIRLANEEEPSEESWEDFCAAASRVKKLTGLAGLILEIKTRISDLREFL